MNHFPDIIKLLRPEQWIKNCFVFAGIFFSENLRQGPLFLRVTITAIAFSLISSCVYILNDIVDFQSDKMHPRKRFRPLPSGKVNSSLATLLAIILAVCGFTLGYIVSTKVVLILLAYVLINILYSYCLKHVVIVDIFCISAGFMLRILAGTIGVGIIPSNWILLCGMMVTLFLGFAKRRAENNGAFWKKRGAKKGFRALWTSFFGQCDHYMRIRSHP